MAVNMSKTKAHRLGNLHATNTQCICLPQITLPASKTCLSETKHKLQLYNSMVTLWQLTCHKPRLIERAIYNKKVYNAFVCHRSLYLSQTNAYNRDETQTMSL